MRYPSPWERHLRVSTAALLAVLALAAVLVVVLAARAGGGGAPAVFAGIAVAILAGAVILSWALAPAGFSIEGDAVRVERRLLPVVIPFASIRSAGLLGDLSAAGALEMGGSSGFFGWYGRFSSRQLGAFRAYATRRKDLVLLETADDLFVLSPETPERFLAEVRSRAPAASRLDGAPAERRRPPRRTKVAFLALLVTVALAVPVVVGVWLAFAPVGASIGPGAIRIERRLAPAVEIPLATVRGVEALAVAEGFRRVSGYIGGGAAFGRFRSPALGEFRLYDWRGGGYVLVETDVGRVVLTPADPEAFVAAVRAARGR